MYVYLFFGTHLNIFLKYLSVSTFNCTKVLRWAGQVPSLQLIVASGYVQAGRQGALKGDVDIYQLNIGSAYIRVPNHH